MCMRYVVMLVCVRVVWYIVVPYAVSMLCVVTSSVTGVYHHVSVVSSDAYLYNRFIN